MRRAIASGLALLLLCSAAVAAEVKILSAGAVEPGLHKAVERFKQATGHEVKIQFNTAPQIAQRMQEGYVADVLIAPPAGLKQQADAGRIAADGHAMLGRVGIGIVVRKDASSPASQRPTNSRPPCSALTSSSTTPRRPGSISSGCSTGSASPIRSRARPPDLRPARR